MKKQKTKVVSLLSRTKVLPVLVIIAVIAVGATSVQIVRADSIQQQINDLNQKNNQAQSTVSSLNLQATSYQDAIDRLQQQISSIQGAINANEAKQAALQTKINADQVKLAQEKQVLGDDIKSMYVNGTMTTVEMLATSNNLSSFVDAETYRGAVQTKIQGTLTEISNLDNELEDQKSQVQSLLTAQQLQQTQLGGDESQQSNLLAMNESQQNTYNAQIKANDNKIATLVAEQIAQNEALFSGVNYGGTTNYPYQSAVCLNPGGDCGANSVSPYNWGVNGQPYDPAGWQYRNCTSYAFWRLDQVTGVSLTAGDFPNVSANGGGIGYSIPDFRNLGYTVDHNPAGATLAVEGAGQYGPGTYGHIMYIESSTSTSAYVSQYNEAGNGLYSTMTITPSSGIWFIHM